MKRINLIGQRFSRLKVLSWSHTHKATSFWNCICDCGVPKVVATGNLRFGGTKSCGCLGREQSAIRFLSHGKTDSDLYAVWANMKARCNNPKNKRFERYGGRGVKVCDRWMVFENFYEDMSPRPEGMTLDRINNDGNYDPTNCKWSTQKQQRRNTSKNIFVRHQGVEMCLEDWAIEIGISRTTIQARIKRGWSPSRALTEPVIFNRRWHS